MTLKPLLLAAAVVLAGASHATTLRVANAGESALALHDRAVRIDRIDRSGVAVLAQKSQRASGGLVGVIGDADQRYRARLEQRLGEARPRHAQPQLRVQQSVQMMITPFGCRVL